MFSWRNLVKKKTKEFELRNLLNKKDSSSGSKMSNLTYEKLNLQNYLTNFDVELAKNIFRYRTRMIQFHGNFSGGGPTNLCPLCGSHSDLQNLSFKCPTVLGEIQIEENYENLFGNNISLEMAKTLEHITKLREK